MSTNVEVEVSPRTTKTVVEICAFLFVAPVSWSSARLPGSAISRPPVASVEELPSQRLKRAPSGVGPRRPRALWKVQFPRGPSDLIDPVPGFCWTGPVEEGTSGPGRDQDGRFNRAPTTHEGPGTPPPGSGMGAPLPRRRRGWSTEWTTGRTLSLTSRRRGPRLPTTNPLPTGSTDHYPDSPSSGGSDESHGLHGPHGLGGSALSRGARAALRLALRSIVVLQSSTSRSLSGFFGSFSSVDKGSGRARPRGGVGVGTEGARAPRRRPSSRDARWRPIGYRRPLWVRELRALGDADGVGKCWRLSADDRTVADPRRPWARTRCHRPALPRPSSAYTSRWGSPPFPSSSPPSLPSEPGGSLTSSSRAGWGGVGSSPTALRVGAPAVRNRGAGHGKVGPEVGAPPRTPALPSGDGPAGWVEKGERGMVNHWPRQQVGTRGGVKLGYRGHAPPFLPLRFLNPWNLSFISFLFLRLWS